jgi:hypothetical protein
MLSSGGRFSIPPRLAGRSPPFVNHLLLKTSHRPIRKIILCSLAAFAMSSCGGPSLSTTTSDPTATVAIITTAEATPASPVPDRMACSDGRLLVGDLPRMDDKWQAGLADATEKATTWQADAKLATLRVGCELLEPGFRWQATYYSPSSQAYFESDTGQIEAAEDDPNAVPTLSTMTKGTTIRRSSILRLASN